MNFEYRLNSYYALLYKEIRRFLKVYHQTIISPAMSGLILFTIFKIAFGEIKLNETFTYAEFIAAGIVAMNMLQNSFANSSSVITAGKTMGYIIDYYMPPLSPWQIILTQVIAGLVRSLLIGGVLISILAFFVKFNCNITFCNIGIVLCGCTLINLLGIICGLLARTFDELAAITNYLVTPLTFLSGTFYSIDKLPAVLQHLIIYNPLYYVIDATRSMLLGLQEADLNFGLMLLLSLNVVAVLVNVAILKAGWRIKS
ncbi:ABC transporter permease [Rickettsiales endosymbiont of Stachyamoeba lipophora]|uniref:ABC transporter permease n=1 Tax=Rickettsiales endosymbiont of Stachyamoeba lipophora TaxID=2486578 RepID=UPI000F64DAA6|nr:ABC transporter permease [Rickettsiales endosymbiont of Stachyamoeba lipophora]AZL15752.1 hypothetical protein EF513_04225 [Rickettsiales endosymbiont of Stachyamoeba lipophora]